MKPIRRALLSAAALSAAMSGFAVAPAHAAEVTLRFHQMLPSMATIPRQAIKPWIEQVEKASGGRIDIKQYDAMALGGKPPELFDQAKDGVVDIIWTVLSYTPGRFPKTEVFELPFMTKNATSGSMAIQDFVERNAMDEFKDVKLIAVHTHGPGAFHTKNPVEKMEDLQGMKIRGAGRVVNDLITKLGATPIGMPVPAVGEALSKGVIDGTTIPFEVVPPLKVQQLVRNHTMFAKGTALYTNTFGVVMNKAKYEALPADLKKVIDDHSGMMAAKIFGEAMDKGDAGGLEAVKKAGNRVIVIDEVEMQRWKRYADQVSTDWMDRTNKAGLNAQALVDDARATIAKYEK
jgi:TRAP-type transport system periplasmic protein